MVPDIENEKDRVRIQYRDEEWLRKKYKEENISSQEISDICGVCHGTVKKWINKFNIKKPWKDEEILRELYLERKMSQRDIAKKFDVDWRTVKRWIERYDIPLREHSVTIRNAKDTAPKVRKHTNGYRYVSSRFKEETDSVLIHRLAAVAWFGYEEVRDKVVHHKNGIRWDNREENLEPMTDSEHKSLHAKEREKKDGKFV